jgi:hypothetical protein
LNQIYPEFRFVPQLKQHLHHTMASDTSLHDDSVPFISLPTEIHLEIVSYLPYPDALALKHTNRYFYSIIKTGVALKVDWVIERSTRRLQVPGKSCSFRTDETFCRGEVRSIMERRRWHQECKPDVGGCLVVEGASCGGSSPLNFLMRKRLGLLLKRSIGGIEMQGRIPASFGSLLLSQLT